MLTQETYKTGMLVNEELMAGVVALEDGSYAVFSTEIETAATRDFKKFEELISALNFANQLVPGAVFETFGCNKGSSCKGAQAGNCEGCKSNLKNNNECC